MSPRWEAPDPYPALGPIALWRWPLVVVKGVPLLALVFGGLLVLLILRQIERPIWGQHRPWTPHITKFVCRNALRIMGIRLELEGSLMPHHGALVANHSSWLDIFVLNACARVYFVSKAEVAGWAGIGWLAKATGTVFIRRERKDARAQRELLSQRLDHGHKLLFFPEGTSTDGRRVLPFKSTLFEALFAVEAEDLWVQPVTLSYHAPVGQDPRFYGWWGDMDFAPHLIWLLSHARQGKVVVRLHDALAVAEQAGRKELAQRSGDAVAGGLSL